MNYQLWTIKSMDYFNSPFIKYSEIAQRLITSEKTLNKSENNEFLSRLLPWLCRTPKFTTYRINTISYDPKYVLGLLTLEIAKLDSSFKNCAKPIQLKHFPQILVLAPFTCSVDDDNMNAFKHVTVDNICGAALMRGAHLYAPGVLSMPTGTSIGEMVSVFIDMDGKCLKGLNKTYTGDKTFIGYGIVRMNRKLLFGLNLSPSGIAVEMKSVISGVPCIGNEFLPVGSAVLQNAPSIICGLVLNPQPGEIILDMCAAPGNKTSHIAELMHHKGIIIALDKTSKRVALIKKMCLEFSISMVYPFVADSTKICSEIDKKDVLFGPPFSKNSFDRILLDAPCSGLGQRPQYNNTLSLKYLKSYAALQRKLFHNAVPLLKPGGHLVYSTCTITSDENEGIVNWALNSFPELSLVPCEPHVGGVGLKYQGLNENQRSYVQRFGPSESTDSMSTKTELEFDFNDTIGFFIAHFFKKEC